MLSALIVYLVTVTIAYVVGVARGRNDERCELIMKALPPATASDFDGPPMLGESRAELDAMWKDHRGSTLKLWNRRSDS